MSKTPHPKTNTDEESKRCAVAVLIPAFNAVAHISSCLKSVLSQRSSLSFEVVVVDDGSSDGTALVIRSSFPEVHYIRQDNQGPGAARNTGVIHSKADIIIFQDADDVMIQGRVEAQASFLLTHNDYAMILGNNASDKDWSEEAALQLTCTEVQFLPDPSFSANILSGENYCGAGTMAVRKAAFLAAGGFPTDVFVAEDMELGLRISEIGRVGLTKTRLNWYRGSNTQSISKSLKKYTDPVTVRHRALEQNSASLDAKTFRRAVAKWRYLLNMDIRFLWIAEGRDAALQELSRFSDLTPRWLILKWNILTRLPPAFGRYLKFLKHRFQMRKRDRD